MISNRKQIVSFAAEPELIDYLNRMAKQDRTTVSQYIRNVLWAGYNLEDYRKEHSADTKIAVEHLKQLIKEGNYSLDDLLEDKGPVVDENGTLKF